MVSLGLPVESMQVLASLGLHELKLAESQLQKKVVSMPSCSNCRFLEVPTARDCRRPTLAAGQLVQPAATPQLTLGTGGRAGALEGLEGVGGAAIGKGVAGSLRIPASIVKR